MSPSVPGAFALSFVHREPGYDLMTLFHEFPHAHECADNRTVPKVGQHVSNGTDRMIEPLKAQSNLVALADDGVT